MCNCDRCVSSGTASASDDGPRCVECNAIAPRTRTVHTLIGASRGWRVIQTHNRGTDWRIGPFATSTGQFRREGGATKEFKKRNSTSARAPVRDSRRPEHSVRSRSAPRPSRQVGGLGCVPRVMRCSDFFVRVRAFGDERTANGRRQSRP